MKVYLDWQLSGDRALLDEFWPKVKRAIAFAWHPGGWDADRDGVFEGAQHNTYDIEFYGPNPLCGIYYLGALRAVEEMSRAVGDDTMAAESRRLFESGRAWIDANLFNGEYYVQQVRGEPRDAILPSLLNTMGSDNTDVPEYQMGNGCLVDQLVGQYQAEVCGLGPLVDRRDHCLKTLRSILRYNYKHALYEHDTVQRTFALNDEAALVIADYGRGTRPDVPFPYYAEVMTGFEYTAASHMIYAGLVAEGIECIGNIRARLRRGTTQPVGRSGVRLALRARDGGLVGRYWPSAGSDTTGHSGRSPRCRGPTSPTSAASGPPAPDGAASPTEPTAARSPSRCCTARSHANRWSSPPPPARRRSQSAAGAWSTPPPSRRAVAASRWRRTWCSRKARR